MLWKSVSFPADMFCFSSPFAAAPRSPVDDSRVTGSPQSVRSRNGSRLTHSVTHNRRPTEIPVIMRRARVRPDKRPRLSRRADHDRCWLSSCPCAAARPARLPAVSPVTRSSRPAHLPHTQERNSRGENVASLGSL